MPSANQVNTDVQFVIATGRDICGRRATQSWTVHVYAPPVIENFTAERTVILPGESTVLTAVFDGSGQIEGLGHVTSGVPIATPVLNTNTTFTLVVSNSVGADVHQALTIDVMATVTSTTPAHGATEVPVNRALIATFSKKMDGATINSATFLLKDSSNNLVMGTVTFADQIAIFAPATLLAARSSYTATITDGVKDVAGNPLVGNYAWSFATGTALDTTPPTVVSTYPANGANRVEDNRLLVAFSERIDPNSANSSSFILKDSSGNPVDGTVRVAKEGNSAEFLVSTALAPMSSYTAIVTTGIKDLAGNTMLGVYSWTFITRALSWQATSTIDAPYAYSDDHTAVWAGSEMIVWGGLYYLMDPTGARYNPVTDLWTPTSKIGAPPAMAGHTAVWTGSEMIISWSTFAGITGARYSPVTDAWLPTTTIVAPFLNAGYTAIWTGSEMVVWDGSTGARYDPVGDTWQAMTMSGTPSARAYHTVVWTGSDMIIWGGADHSQVLVNTGARYNPVTDTWLAITTTGAPSARGAHRAVWTGSEMIVWGGYDSSGLLNTGGKYAP